MKFLEPVFAHAFNHPTGVFGWMGGIFMARENRETARRALQLLEVQPHDKVLEIGFGPGVGIELLANSSPAHAVAGVDPSPEMCEQARVRNAANVRAGKVTLWRAPVEALPFSNATFDKALAIRSLDLWPDTGAGLREIRRVIRSGGRIVIAVGRHSGQTPDGLAKLLTDVHFFDVLTLDAAGALYVCATKLAEDGQAAR